MAGEAEPSCFHSGTVAQRFEPLQDERPFPSPLDTTALSGDFPWKVVETPI